MNGDKVVGSYSVNYFNFQSGCMEARVLCLFGTESADCVDWLTLCIPAEPITNHNYFFAEAIFSGNLKAEHTSIEEGVIVRFISFRLSKLWVQSLETDCARNSHRVEIDASTASKVVDAQVWFHYQNIRKLLPPA